MHWIITQVSSFAHIGERPEFIIIADKPLVDSPPYTGCVAVRIQVISNLPEFYALKPAWDDIYKEDSCATVTRSWQWMLGWLESTDLNWQILAVEDQQSDRIVALAPLAFKINSKGNIALYPGGYPHSAHSGFLCKQDYVTGAIALLSSYIERQVSWDRLFLENVMDDRLPMFVSHYQKYLSFNIIEQESTICPYLRLPGSWDSYFNEFLGKETRKTFRKKLARLARSPGIMITAPDSVTLPVHIDALLTLNEGRWGKYSAEHGNQIGAILRSCYRQDSLYLRIMWRGDIAIAGIAVFIDQVTKSAHCFMTAYHPSVYRLSVGNILILESLRYAIENGLELYDFGRGGEDYKFQCFRAQVRQNSNLAIIRLGRLSKIKRWLKHTLIPTPLMETKWARAMTSTISAIAGK